MRATIGGKRADCGLGDRRFTSREAFKAFAQNIGHDSEITTFGPYLKVSQERQAELMRGTAYRLSLSFRSNLVNCAPEEA